MKNGESVIEVRGMTKRFGELTAVDHVDLTVAAAQLFAPSVSPRKLATSFEARGSFRILGGAKYVPNSA